MTDKIRSFLPLTEPTFYILLSLVPGSKHGYAILKDVDALSNGEIRLSTSTLYTALSRLQDLGLIERIPNTKADSGGPGLPRKAYRLSKTGGLVLEAQTKRMGAIVITARGQLGLEEDGL